MSNFHISNQGHIVILGAKLSSWCAIHANADICTDLESLTHDYELLNLSVGMDG